jgi:hypothetical protein
MSNSLLDQLNSSPFDFYMLVVDEFLDIDIPELYNFISLSPKLLGINLEQKNSGRLLNHPSTIEYITKNSQKSGRKPAIIPFKPSAKVDVICQKNNWDLVANPSFLNRSLEDKIKFASICEQNQIKIVPNQIAQFGQKSFENAQHSFGAKLVTQTHFGWAGNSSFLADTWMDIKNKIPSGTIVKYSPYLKGYSLINNCCLTSQGLIQSPPGLQYTGLKPLTQNPLATVGRQWPSFAPDSIQDQLRLTTIKFADVLSELEYVGFFGLDFLVHENEVYLIECNPRLTASYAFYTQLEIKCNLTPLFFYHLAEFTGIKYSIDIDSESKRFQNSNIIGSEITAKDTNGTTIKKFQQQIPFTKTVDPIVIDINIISNVL